MADARLQVVLEALDKTKAGMSSAMSGIERYKGQLRTAGIALTAFGAAGTAAFGLTIKAASDVEESINAVRVMFGEGAKAILDFGQTAAKTTGLSRAAFNQLASTTGAMLLNFGIPMNKAADQTIALTRRAADLASVFNTDVNDAMAAIQSGLQGMALPLRRYAIDVTEATLQTQALAMGIKKSVTEMTQSEKATIRLAAIMSQSEKVAGDFINTSDSFANSMRVLKADIANTSATMGEVLLPVASKLLGWTHNMVSWLGDLNPLLFKVGVFAGTTATSFSSLAGPALILATALPGLKMALPGIVAGLKAVAEAAWAAAAGFAAMLPVILLVAAGAAFLASIVDNLVRLVRDKPALQIWEQFDLLLDTLKEKVKGLTSELAGSLDPALSEIKNSLQGTTASAKKFADQLERAKQAADGFAGDGIERMTHELDKAKAPFSYMMVQLEKMGRSIEPLHQEWLALVSKGIAPATASMIVGTFGIARLNQELEEMAGKLEDGTLWLQAMRAEELSEAKIFELLTARIKEGTEAIEGQAESIRLLTATSLDWLRVLQQIADLEARQGKRAIGPPPQWQVLPGPSELALRRAREQAEAISWERIVEEATRPVEMQHGGLILRPTVALLGERGPEAVVPLAALERLAERIAQAVARSGGGQNIVLTLDGRVLATALGRMAEIQEQVRA